MRMGPLGEAVAAQVISHAVEIGAQLLKLVVGTIRGFDPAPGVVKQRAQLAGSGGRCGEPLWIEVEVHAQDALPVGPNPRQPLERVGGYFVACAHEV
jgi:hypothetical protein